MCVVNQEHRQRLRLVAAFFVVLFVFEAWQDFAAAPAASTRGLVIPSEQIPENGFLIVGDIHGCIGRSWIVTVWNSNPLAVPHERERGAGLRIGFSAPDVHRRAGRHHRHVPETQTTTHRGGRHDSKRYRHKRGRHCNCNHCYLFFRMLSTVDSDGHLGTCRTNAYRVCVCVCCVYAGPSSEGVIQRLIAVGALGVLGNNDAAVLSYIDGAVDELDGPVNDDVVNVAASLSQSSLQYLRSLVCMHIARTRARRGNRSESGACVCVSRFVIPALLW